MQEPAPRHSIEEQKTRLWAMSFESTKQVVACHKCGTPNVVNRLVQDQNAVPVRREMTPPEVTQSPPALELAAKAAEDKLIIRQDLSRELRRSKSAIFLLSTLSAGLTMALLTVVARRRS